MKLQFSVLLLSVLAVVGCSEAVKAPAAKAPSESTTEVAVSSNEVQTVAAEMPSVQFKVPDMMCEESCAKAVHDTLAAQPGAKEVVVDFPNRLATVTVDEAEFDSQAALAALLDKQFTSTTLVGTQDAASSETSN